MTPRIDSASRVVQASPMEVYRAFAEPGAMERWLPPTGMTGRMLHFDFREGGSYRMRLAFDDPEAGRGKTSDDADEVLVALVRLQEGRAIEQEVVFDAEDPAFAGTMRMVWSFEAVGGGTRVTVQAENVPPGISPEDHAAGLESTLENLEAFVRQGE
jgi:uncharacterized protein YndB with AHSA1/START domain